MHQGSDRGLSPWTRGLNGAAAYALDHDGAVNMAVEYAGAVEAFEGRVRSLLSTSLAGRRRTASAGGTASSCTLEEDGKRASRS